MGYCAIDEPGFPGGVNGDVPPWLLPPGSLADASNLIFDRPGIARVRGGTTAVFSGAQTAHSTSLGWAHSQDANLIEELYGVNGANGNVVSINKLTGAATVIAGLGWGSPAVIGRPCRHFGFLAFPSSSAALGFISPIVAGQVASTIFLSTANASTTAFSPRITLTGSDVTTNIRVGGIVVGTISGGLYVGRVISVDTAKIFSVWPTPTQTMTFSGGGLTTGPVSIPRGGRCVASFQNRLLWGNSYDVQAYVSSSLLSVADRRVNYSVLPTEPGINALGTTYGAAFYGPLASPPKNFFEVPGADPIIAMEPVSDDELLILTTGGVMVFKGTLATQNTAEASGYTWDISPLNTNAGCLSDLSVQRTPHGIIWASAEGIMAYTGGGKLQDLTEGRYHTAWRNLTRGSNFAVHGAAYVRNHYIVTGTSAGSTFALAFNLDNGTWAPLAGLDIFYAIPRPTDYSQVYALRWFAQSGGAPSMTNGQVTRWESIFAPTPHAQGIGSDADGSTIGFSATSRSITDDKHTQRITRRIGLDYRADMIAPNISVQAGSRLDSTDTVGAETVALGSLSSTQAKSVASATVATPVIVTVAGGHGYQTGDHVDVHGVTANPGANGHYRITVLDTTRFSLNGSKGSGTTGLDGDVKKITEAEFECSHMDIGQATYVTLASTGLVRAFELHGLRVGVLEMPRGMG